MLNQSNSFFVLVRPKQPQARRTRVRKNGPVAWPALYCKAHLNKGQSVPLALRHPSKAKKNKANKSFTKPAAIQRDSPSLPTEPAGNKGRNPLLPTQ